MERGSPILGSGVSALSGGASGRGSTLRASAASGGASGAGSGAGSTRRLNVSACRLNQKKNNNNNKAMKRL